MTIIAIIAVVLNCMEAGTIYLLWRDSRQLQREVIELEEKAQKYYMRLLGEASKKDA